MPRTCRGETGGVWSYMAKQGEVQRRWYVLDAEDKVLGRTASAIARILRGKHRPIYTPHVDTGDFVIVVNADKIKLTGRKTKQKIYYRHSQYPGGLKSISYEKMMQTHPTRVIQHAVKGMLPHNRLGAAMLRRLKVYPDSSHPHQAQLKGQEGATDTSQEREASVE